MRNLLLFTSYFPLKKGDYIIIKDEIGDLANHFDKIFIFSLESGGSEMNSTALPSNVSSIPGLLSCRRKLFIDSLKSKFPIQETCLLFFSEVKKIKNYGHFKSLILSLLIIRSQHTRTLNFLKNNPDINNSNTCCYYFWGTGLSYTLASSENPLIRFPSLIRFHGGDLYLERQNGYIPFRKKIFKKANILTSVSQLGTQYLNNQLVKYHINKIATVLRLGTIDYTALSNTTQNSNHVSSQNENSSLNRLVVIVSCSRVIPLKRVDLIYNALNIAAGPSLPIKWIHFGDGPELNNIKNNTTSPKNEYLKITFNGDTDHSKIIQFYINNNVDLFINASTTEGIPVSIMEAISFNIPILASDAGGTKEIVSQVNKTGITFPVDISDYELSKIIKQFCDELLFQHCKYSPRDFWEKNYSQNIANQNLITQLDLLFKIPSNS